jgi:D-amino peptidase
MKNLKSASDRKSISDLQGILLAGIILFISVIFAGCGNKRVSAKGSENKSDGKIKLFMLWDMEGTSGLFNRNQTWFWEKGVTSELKLQGQELLTADVNSAARAAFDAGADELIICDTHSGGNVILTDKLIKDKRITFLPRSQEKGQSRWMPGLDESVDGFMVMAHHAKAGTKGAFLPHTQNAGWDDFTINGISVGEIGIEGCFAGNWNIPVIMATGDDSACVEAQRLFPGIITAVVKHAESPDKAYGPDAEAARAIVAAKVKEAVKKLRDGGNFTAFETSLPMKCELKLSTSKLASKLAARPGVERIDSLRVGATVSSRGEVIQWISGTGF